MIRFEDQQLTSYSGLLIFQLLFRRINLKNRLKKCFALLTVSPILGRHLIVMLIVIHLLIGFRRLREVDYYRDDPIVLRLTGLRKLPDVSTISRALSQMEKDGVENVRKLSRSTLKLHGNPSHGTLVTVFSLSERKPKSSVKACCNCTCSNPGISISTTRSS